MKVVIQRVKQASVEIDNSMYSKIYIGLLIFLGIEKGDSVEQAEYLTNKIVNLRIFNDENKKMNLSLIDIKGEILVVSQFTLVGDCSKGKRPGFDKAAKPEEAIPLYEKFIKLLKDKSINVQTGVFGADMQVSIINDGPVTFVIETSLV
jgi:D-tyrosyl-tRNA(Tyr) deacylase